MALTPIDALKTLQGFSALPDSAIAEIAAFTAVRKVRAGETVFAQGEPSPYFFGVCSGEVIIQRVSKDARFPNKVLGMVGTGGLFGESAIFEESPRAAMASAYKDGELLAVRGSDFRAWLKKNAEVSQSLLMTLFQTANQRLFRTSHELTVIYGVGRLLGSAKPYADQIAAAMEYFKSSLEGLDELILYKRSAYWEEFEPVLSLPSQPDLPSVPLTNELAHKVSSTGALFAFDPKAYRMPLQALGFDWGTRPAAVMIPLFDWEKPSHPLQGLLLLASTRSAEAFAADKQLLLTSVAQPVAEAMSRHSRQQDADAQTRLSQSRQTYRP